MTEEYRRLKEFPNYRIYSNGSVFSELSNKWLRKHTDTSGYIDYVLYNGHKSTKKAYKAHVLVAKLFIPNPNNYQEVNHIDRDKKNNNMSNLEWCSRQYNVNYDIVQRMKSGQNAISPLTEEMVKLVPELINYGCSIKLVAKLYKVGHITIRNIVKRHTWRNLNLNFNKVPFSRTFVYLPIEIYNTLKSFNVDNTVLNSRVKILESV